jgi:hypothetical protein
MCEAPSEFDLCWCDLAIVAKAPAGGRDMNEIGLMRDIAKRTVALKRIGLDCYDRPSTSSRSTAVS